MHIYDQIQELRAELAGCILTPTERRGAKSEIEKLLAQLDAQDRTFDPNLPDPPGA